jgi:hypothetical protein
MLNKPTPSNVENTIVPSGYYNKKKQLVKLESNSTPFVFSHSDPTNILSFNVPINAGVLQIDFFSIPSLSFFFSFFSLKTPILPPYLLPYQDNLYQNLNTPTAP